MHTLTRTSVFEVQEETSYLTQAEIVSALWKAKGPNSKSRKRARASTSSQDKEFAAYRRMHKHLVRLALRALNDLFASHGEIPGSNELVDALWAYALVTYKGTTLVPNEKYPSSFDDEAERHASSTCSSAAHTALSAFDPSYMARARFYGQQAQVTPRTVPVERLMMMAADPYLTNAEWAAEFEVTERTISRYRAILRGGTL